MGAYFVVRFGVGVPDLDDLVFDGVHVAHQSGSRGWFCFQLVDWDGIDFPECEEFGGVGRGAVPELSWGSLRGGLSDYVVFVGSVGDGILPK